MFDTRRTNSRRRWRCRDRHARQRQIVAGEKQITGKAGFAARDKESVVDLAARRRVSAPGNHCRSEDAS